MGTNIRPYQEQLAPPLRDYTEWGTGALRMHVQDMLEEKDSANWRKADELERDIQHACFEISRRQADYERFRENLAALAGHMAVGPEVAC